jgi:hypothetical protein
MRNFGNSKIGYALKKISGKIAVKIMVLCYEERYW